LRQILIAAFAVLLGSTLVKLGNALLSLTVVLELNRQGVPKQEIGFVAATFMVGFLAGSLYARRVIGQLGHVRAFAGITAVAAIVTLLFPLIDDSIAWALFRCLYGFAGAVTYIVFESWLNERATAETRGRMLSFYGTTNYFAMTLGQLLINVTALGSFAFTLSAVLILAGMVPVIATRLPQPAISEVSRLSPRALFRHSPLAAVAVIGGGLINGGLFGLNAVFAQEIGLDLLQTSLFTGSTVFGAFLLLWLIGRLSDRFGRRAALAWALTVAVITSLLLAFSGELGLGFWELLVLSLVQGGHLLSVYHSAVAHAYDRLPRQHYVAASASFQIFFSVGSIVGPILVGYLMQYLGPYSLWFYVAGVSALLLVFVAYRWVVRPQVEVDAEAPTPKPPREGVTA